jgi:hypothetical protein
VFELAEAESLVSVSRLRDENGEGSDVDEEVADEVGTKNQAN